jgi:cation diffusion facilitator CzcD-associated flavoprotein CzcO
MRTRRARARSGAGEKLSVAIVGAGFGGISAGIELVRAGIDAFTIFDSAERVGGTWWHNQYPGCEVDVESYIYSFPYKRYDWTRTHARQPELHRYLEETVEEFGLVPHLRLETGVDRAVWDEGRHVYRLALSTGEQVECNVLICATGFLNVPNMPDWPGLETFRGPCFHTARWEHEHDLRGKTIAVVGTGSTASQLVPAIADQAGKLYLFQREPGWVIPKGDHELAPEQRARFQNPIRHRIARARWFWTMEKRLWNGGTYVPGSPENRAAEQAGRDLIAREFADRPDLAAAVTPNHPFWGKRPIFNSTFYAALKHPNVELVPRAVEAVTPKGVVDADGVEREVDILVIATGFQATNYLGRIEVVGREGTTLHEYWGDEPRAFLGITVPTFPNLFILYGPGTNGGEIASNLRNQARFARRSIQRMLRRGATAVEVKRTWADVYHAWLQSKMHDTAWATSANYFKSASGKVVTQWPYSAVDYGLLTRLLGRLSETTRRWAAESPRTRTEAQSSCAVEDHGRTAPSTPALGETRFV